MKVLVADDESISRIMLQETLRSEGYEVIAVDNGGDALEQLCATGGPRLALLDWVMPGMNGPAVCVERRNRLDLDYAYMFLLTKRGEQEDVVAGLQSGADEYVIKPFDPEVLKARLQTGVRILKLENELRYRAEHDDFLTELWNRQSMVRLLEKELARSEPENTCCAIMLCDLDHFKPINDTYGHEVGNTVLREVAQRLVASVRNYDHIGRYGGDEFLILLTRCDTDRADARADQIRQAIWREEFATPRGPVRIGISIGLLVFNGRTVRPAAQILREIDAAMYSAKAEGGNGFRFATPMGLRIPR